MEIGIKGEAKLTVTNEVSAKTMGSGALDVLATPEMVALMEKAAWTSVQPYLEEGQGTVGISMNITHDAPTPLRMQVTAKSTLTAIDGRKLKFTLEAFDEKGKIGQGEHERFIINSEKFQAKANAKM